MEDRRNKNLHPAACNAGCSEVPPPPAAAAARGVRGDACIAWAPTLLRPIRKRTLAAMPGPGDKPKRQGSRLDAETLAYYGEIDGRMAELQQEDAEERSLLADNALGEAGGREAEVATDAACSRVLERLLPHASTEALCTFTRACVEGESLGAMCTRCGRRERRPERRRAACAMHAPMI